MSATLTEHQQAAITLADQVIVRAQQAGFVISGEIRRAANGALRTLTAKKLPPVQFLREFLREFRLILNRYEPVMARTLSDASLAAWIQGGRGVVQLLPQVIQPPPSPPSWTALRMPGDAEPIIRFPIIEQAAADLAARQILTPSQFHDQQAVGRILGFTVGKTSSLDAIEKVRDALTEAIVQGDSVRTFRRKAADAINASGISPSRVEMVFRNTLNTSYARGQKAVVEHPAVRSAIAFAWRAEIDDSRLTPLCAHLSHSGIQGTGIYSIDDPAWRKVAPPSHFGCRCGAVFISIDRAAKKGIEVAKKWIADGIRPSDEELFVQPITFPTGLLSPSELAAWEAWSSPWAA